MIVSLALYRKTEICSHHYNKRYNSKINKTHGLNKSIFSNNNLTNVKRTNKTYCL